MSDDLVKRLRVQANRRSGYAHMMSDGSIKWHPMLDEAADEIERLNAENKRLRSNLDTFDRVLRVGLEGKLIIYVNGGIGEMQSSTKIEITTPPTVLAPSKKETE